MTFTIRFAPSAQVDLKKAKSFYSQTDPALGQYCTDSFFSMDTSTHYINATHVIRLSPELLCLPKEQHDSYQWIAIDDLEQNSDVHKYSKIFLPELKSWMDNHD